MNRDAKPKSREWSVWKDTLYPGRVVVNGQEFEFTAADIHNAERVGNERLKDYFVPLCWEHDPEALPLSLSDAAKRARSVFGSVRSYRVDSNGVLQAELVGVDPKDAERFAKTKFVSPMLHWDWVGGDGKKWDGLTIQHVAATPVPVQHKQRPVELSHDAKISAGFSGPIYLSLANYKGQNMADKTDEVSDVETEEAPAENDYFAKAMEMLPSKGINLPEDTNPDNFWERLVVALHALGQEDDDMPGDEGMPAQSGNDIAPTAQPPGVGLSMAEQKAVARATTLTRKELNARIEFALENGQVTPPISKRLKEYANKISLSFDANGELKSNKLIIQLEAYEALPKGSVWSKRAELSHGEVRSVKSPFAKSSDTENDEEFMEEWDKTGKK